MIWSPARAGETRRERASRNTNVTECFCARPARRRRQLNFASPESMMDPTTMTRRGEIKEQALIPDEDKAWLLGHLVGDGCVTDHGVSIHVGLDEEMGHYCCRLLDEVYGVPARVVSKEPGKARRTRVNYEVQCYRTAVAQDLRSIGDFGTHRWRVPSPIRRGSRFLKGEWVSGFFDAEGSVIQSTKGRRRVTASSTNLVGLRQVERILSEDLGIETAWAVRRADLAKNHRESYSLNITNRVALERFAIWCGFRSEAKHRKLTCMVSSYWPDSTNIKSRNLGEQREDDEVFDRLLLARFGFRTKLRDSCDQQVIEEARLLRILSGQSRRAFRTKRQNRMADALPVIVSMRAEGRPWKEIGRVLGFKGDDQRVAVLALNVVQWAHRRGLRLADFAKEGR